MKRKDTKERVPDTCKVTIRINFLSLSLPLESEVIIIFPCDGGDGIRPGAGFKDNFITDLLVEYIICEIKKRSDVRVIVQCGES